MPIDFRRLVTTTDKNGNPVYSEVSLIAIAIITVIVMVFLVIIVVFIVRPHEDNSNIITVMFMSSGPMILMLLNYMKTARVEKATSNLDNKVDKHTEFAKEAALRNHEAIVQTREEIAEKVTDIKTDTRDLSKSVSKVREKENEIAAELEKSQAEQLPVPPPE